MKEGRESGGNRVEVLKEMARESYKRADALQWDASGYNAEKSRLLDQANRAVDELAKIEGIEPGEVTYEYLGMEKPGSRE